MFTDVHHRVTFLRSLSQVDKRNLGRSLVLPQVECDGLKSVCVFAIGKTIS